MTILTYIIITFAATLGAYRGFQNRNPNKFSLFDIIRPVAYALFYATPSLFTPFIILSELFCFEEYINNKYY
jgi:uncharacterized membrane protein YwaF